MTRLTLVRRSHDWMATIEGVPEIWGCGRTPVEAVERLATCHPNWFGGTEVVATWRYTLGTYRGFVNEGRAGE